MVTEISKGRELNVPKFRGLSKDDKPMNVPNGAEFLEIDTGDNYLFDESVPEWVKCNYCGGGGGGGAGYTVTTTETVLVPQQNITVDYYEQPWADLTGNLVEPENGDTCVVTFNGTDYTVTAVTLGDWTYVGELDTSGEIPAPVFTTYPFCIRFYELYDDPGTLGATLNIDPEGTLSGTFAVKAAQVTKTITLTDDFKTAAQTAVTLEVEFYEDNGAFYINKSYNELYALFTAGVVPYYMSAFTDDGVQYTYRYELTGMWESDPDYTAQFECAGQTSNFIASDPDDPMLWD